MAEHDGGADEMSAAIRPRLLVVSHPAILGVNQLPYAELARRGWEVEVVVPLTWRSEYSGEEVGAEVLAELAGRVRPLPVVLPGRPQRHAYRVNPMRVVRSARPDVMFLEQEPFSLCALEWGAAAVAAGVPFGVQADENLDRSFPGPVRAARRWVLSHAAFVAARSPTAGDLARRWGARGEVSLVPHHVPGWESPSRASSREFRVGYAGRLVPEKGLDVLVDAVRAMGRGVELVVAGDGPLRDWLTAQDLGGARLRMLTGISHDRMDRAYAEMDVLVLPSRTTDRWVEQFGRVLVEAPSCGIPVVGADSGEIPWVVETTGGGVVVPEGDAPALAAALDQLRNDPALRERYAEAGGAQARKRFSVPATATALEDLMVQAIGAPEGRPRVAIVAHGVHDKGGMERACAELIRRTHNRAAITVVASELAPDLEPLVDRWVRVRVPMRPIPLKFVAFFVRAGLALRRLNVDLVHTVGAIVPNRADVVTVQFCHAGARVATGRIAPASAPALRQLNTMMSYALARIAERWCYRPGRVRTLAPVSQGVADEVTAHFAGLPMTIVPNGVDADRFRPDPTARREVRDGAGIGHEQLVALFVGGDWDRKGLGLAIEGVAKARSEGADIVLWIVGPGDEDRYGRLATRFGIGDVVRFFGRRADTERFYRGADVFVFPTAYEAFSLAMLEAAASGLPLVVPPVNGVEELSGPGGGAVVTERSASGVAAALVGLATDEDRRVRLGQQARRRADGFTWQSSATTTERLYRELLARPATSERRTGSVA